MTTQFDQPLLAEGLIDGEGPFAFGETVALRASWCSACDRYEFPYRATCPSCGAASTAKALSGSAVISGFSDVRFPPPGSLVPAPYAVAVADFAEGVSILGLIVGPTSADELTVGEVVQTVAADVGGKVGWGFKPSA